MDNGDPRRGNDPALRRDARDRRRRRPRERDVVGDSGPYPLLIGVFLLSALLGQLISNMATALIMIPVALSAAAELDVAAAPVLMSLNVT